MTSVNEILEQLRQFSYDERDKGSRFEKLIQAYLKTEPQYSQLFDEVWVWNEYPHREGRPDTGIDLVARNKDTGELTAIQCKFFDEKSQVTKPMLDSFLAASSSAREGRPEFSERLIVSTSDNWGKNAEEAILNQMPPVSRLRAADLADSAIDWAQFLIEIPSRLVTKAKITKQATSGNTLEQFLESPDLKTVLLTAILASGDNLKAMGEEVLGDEAKLARLVKIIGKVLHTKLAS